VASNCRVRRRGRLPLGNEWVSIRHNGDLAAKIRDAQRVLGLATKFYDDAQAKIDRLASVSPTQARQTRERLQELFTTGLGHDLPGI
jgi:hypothetical protein